jgi:chloride channel protein, CIC family
LVLQRAARRIGAAPYVLRWLVIGPCIGALAGAGVIALWALLLACTHVFLSSLAGYHVPTTARQGSAPGSRSMARPWALPLVVGLGALAGSLLVVRFAPEESEGNGTDAAIATCHRAPRSVRVRAVVVRLVASALTIGSGGSGGQAGPSGHIGAGLASWLSRAFDLDARDARVAVAAGIGSAIGAILGAPLGGAVLGAEILYRDGLDATVLFPGALASGVAYLVFGAAEGFSPLFGHVPYHFAAAQLGWFAVIGVLGGLIGLLYAKGFYAISELFGRSPLPGWLNPVAGGLLVGAIAIGIPEVLGTGFGWVQKSLGPGLLSIPLWIVLLLPLVRIVTTGLSVGSGGSGGVFAPGIVMGAFIGGSVWRVFEPHATSMGHDPAPYVIVGMMACLGAISRAPVAVMLMAAEMTGGLAIVLPAVLAVGLAWCIVRVSGDTIYRSQLRAPARLV